VGNKLVWLLVAVFRNNKRGLIMTIRLSRLGAWAHLAALGMGLVLVCSATASGGDAERKAVFAKVNPSVVQVRQEKSLGSGFVIAVHGDEAIVATNYHVIEGAKKITIFFPADDREMKNGLESEGYLEILPTRDLALVHFKLKGRKVAPLKVANKLPEQGDTVYTFGSPVGQSNTIAAGMVSCVRSGQEVADLMDRLGKDTYTKGMGYTLDATWIQHTAPMSHGNSGGPLTNDKGEVVGLNTMNFAPEGTSAGGQQLNYAISAIHVTELLKNAGSNVKPWSALPPPRERRGPETPLGDPEKTMALWKDCNRFKNALNDEIGVAEDKLARVQPLSQIAPVRFQNQRNKQLSKIYLMFKKAYSAYATNVRAANSEMADPALITHILKEASTAEELSGIYQQCSTLVLDQGAGREVEQGQTEVKHRVLTELRNQYDVLRVSLSLRYHKTFPTLEETRKESKKREESTVKPGAGYRMWTSRNGKFSIEARLVKAANGEVTLLSSDGRKITVPVEKLSDADQEFVKNRAMPPGDKEKELQDGWLELTRHPPAMAHGTAN
jgi:S1-C subfamily serine protease